MLEHLSGFIIQFISQTSYVGIFVLMTLEAALIPIPSEVTMPFSGFLAQQGTLSFFLVVLTGAIANVIGSLIGYGIGYYLEEMIIVSLIKRYGKFLLLTIDDYETAMKWLKKYGDGVTFFSRVLPAVRTFISLPAGLAHMNLMKFSLYTFLGSLLWSFVLTYVGYYLGSQWKTIGGYFHKFDLVIGVLLVVCVLWYINHKLKILKF